MNGDYFPFTGDPLGVGVMNGEIYSEPYRTDAVPARAAFGLLPDGKPIVGLVSLHGMLAPQNGFTLPITGVDRMTSTTDPADIVVYTPRYGPSTGARGNGTEILVTRVNLPLSPGKQMMGRVDQIVTGSATASKIPVDGVVFSVPFGSTHAAEFASEFHVGDTIGFVCGIKDVTTDADGGAPDDPDIWDQAQQIIGGGPILLHHGQVIVDDSAEGFDNGFSNGPHARTAVGARADGKIVIVTVDDNPGISAGISLHDLAYLMKSEGAVDAINLDGGGSTTMVADGVSVSDPSGTGAERPVADMLTVAAKGSDSITITDPATIVLPSAPLQVGQTYSLFLRSGDQLVSGAQQNLVWNGPAGNVGFVSQDGKLHILRTGHATIVASYNGARLSSDIDVIDPAETGTTPQTDSDDHPETRTSHILNR